MAERENQELMNITDLSVSYRSSDRTAHAVRNLPLSLHEAETLRLARDPGAGKTTTALSILRILPEISVRSISGQILFHGSDLLQKSQKEMRRIRGEQISMIFQDPMTSLDPVNTVGAQIAEMISLHSDLSKKEVRHAAERMLETVGIRKERYDDYPHQFSGGMKQRVVIAMALSCNPQLLIADEPTTALDVTIQAQILELMQELKQSYNTSMILITHDLGVVAEICDTVAILYAGQIVEYGTAEQIYNHCRHPYTEGLFHSIPDLDTEQKRLQGIAGLTPDPSDIPSGCAFHPRCPYAAERCAREEPQAWDIGEGHIVKCFLASAEEGSH